MKRGWPILRALTLGASLLTFNASAAFTNLLDPFLTLSQPVVTNGQVLFTLTGESHVEYVIEGSGDTQLWLPLVTNSSLGITRSISLPEPGTNTLYRASRQRLPVFAAAIAAKSWIDFRSNYVRFDSFDAADPFHDDPLDPNEVKANGHVAAVEGLTNVHNLEIKGKLKTGPSWPIWLGPQSSIGDLNFPRSGIQAGWYEDDFRFVFPDVVPPFTNGVPPVEIPLSTNRWQLSGDYYVSGDAEFGTDENILVTGYTRLYVTGEFMMRGSAVINILPGATLKLYVGGPNAVFQQVHTAGDASTFSYFGLPTNTSINWQGNVEYKGTVYAPQALFNLGSGGIEVKDFQGACVANSVVLNGRFSYHFDENLIKKTWCR